MMEGRHLAAALVLALMGPACSTQASEEALLLQTRSEANEGFQPLAAIATRMAQHMHHDTEQQQPAAPTLKDVVAKIAAGPQSTSGPEGTADNQAAAFVPSRLREWFGKVANGFRHPGGEAPEVAHQQKSEKLIEEDARNEAEIQRLDQEAKANAKKEAEAKAAWAHIAEQESHDASKKVKEAKKRVSTANAEAQSIKKKVAELESELGDATQEVKSTAKSAKEAHVQDLAAKKVLAKAEADAKEADAAAKQAELKVERAKAMSNTLGQSKAKAAADAQHAAKRKTDAEAEKKNAAIESVKAAKAVKAATAGLQTAKDTAEKAANEKAKADFALHAIENPSANPSANA